MQPKFQRYSMYERKIPIDIECGVVVFMEIVCAKWKPYLIIHIHNGEHRPKELEQGIPTAARRVLNKQLKELEEAGIVRREVFAEIPMRVEYYLTEVGESLYPIIAQMEQWGDAHRYILQ